jgi:hypothetical protein
MNTSPKFLAAMHQLHSTKYEKHFGKRPPSSVGIMLNLDVDSPEKVAVVLRRAVDAFHQSATELSGAWQDRSAGKPWETIAVILESAASQIERKI